MPQISAAGRRRVPRAGRRAPEPPTDMRGMIEGLLWQAHRRSPGVSPARAGRNCAPSRDWWACSTFSRRSGCWSHHLGDPSPNRRFARNLASRPRASPFRRSCSIFLAVGWGAWSANEPSVGNVPDVGVGTGCDETVGAGLRSERLRRRPSEEVAIAVRSAGASL